MCSFNVVDVEPVLPIEHQTNKKESHPRDFNWFKIFLSLQERDVNGNGITIVSDSEGQDSEGQNSHRASGGHSVSHSFTRSGKCDTGRKMKRSTEMDSSKCHKGVQTDTPKPQDCDEYYFMTLTKVFKKLAPQKKAGVRMKIEHLLLEAQFT